MQTIKNIQHPLNGCIININLDVCYYILSDKKENIIKFDIILILLHLILVKQNTKF